MSEALVVIADQGTLDWGADLPVEPDGGVEREEALDDACPQPWRDPAAVSFQAKLVLQGPNDRLDALAQPVRKRPGLLFVLAGRADQGQAEVRAGEELFGLLTGQALVSDDGGAGRRAIRGLVPEHLPGLLASPYSFGLARPNPVTVPSQVQISRSLAPQYQREWLGQYPYPAYPYRSERRAVITDWPHGTGVASISRTSSAVAGVASASHRSAASISGAAALSRVLYSDWHSSRGNRCPTCLAAARSQRRSSSNRSSTWATAMHTSSASVTSGRCPGPLRMNPRPGMMRSVSSTYSAIRRVSRSAIMTGSRVRACVRTPILGTLRLPRNLHQIAGRRSRPAGTPGRRRPGSRTGTRSRAGTSRWPGSGPPYSIPLPSRCPGDGHPAGPRPVPPACSAASPGWPSAGRRTRAGLSRPWSGRAPGR